MRATLILAVMEIDFVISEIQEYANGRIQSCAQGLK
jgi:hypothetical protein